MVAERLVPDIPLLKPHLRMHGCPETGLQIVRDNDVIAIVDEFIYRVAADVPGAAKYQYFPMAPPGF